MDILDYLKPLFKEEVDLEEVKGKLTQAVNITPDKVKEWVALPENKPVFDHIASKAINSHIEKEKIARGDWEKKREAELAQQITDKIAKDQQKSPEMQKIEELEKQLAREQNEKTQAALKAHLFSIVDQDKLPVHTVDPFIQYGEKAEESLRDFATKNAEIIDSMVKKQIADKFGGAGMTGDDKKTDDTPVSTADWLKDQGFNNNET